MDKVQPVRSSAVLVLLLTGAAGLFGCDTRSEWPEPGEQLPGWVYDAPYYYEPRPENYLQAADAGADGIIPHYYTREMVAPVKRPDASPASCTPRLAVYYSDDHCQSWHKAGYFGLDQTFFAFVAPSEGTYAVRFAGPGIPPTRLCPTVPPHRVYHFDQTPPCVTVQISPAKECYQVGDAITVSWSVADANIDRDAKVTIYELASPTTVRVLGEDFPLCGSLGAWVPASAAECGMRFAVEATDKAGNVGRGFSFMVLAPSGQQPTPPAAISGPTHVPPAMPPTTVPAGGVPTCPTPTCPPPTTTTPPSSSDVPVVPAPTLPLDPNIQPRSARPMTDPADNAVEQAYRPKLYPSSQQEQ